LVTFSALFFIHINKVGVGLREIFHYSALPSDSSILMVYEYGNMADTFYVKHELTVR